MIDRAEDGTGDAVRPARHRPAGVERGDASPTDSPAVDDLPAGAGRTDAVLANTEQRAAAHRQYRDTVDHTYDVARMDAGQDGEAASPGGGGARDAGDAETQEGDSPDENTPDGNSGDAAESGSRETRDSEARDNETRDAWAEALPGLRAAWLEHEQRFPGRSRSAPSSQADGGWLAEGGRRLSPEQNTEASKACEDIRAEGKEVVLPAMERVEAADPDRRLAGLEHMLRARTG